MGLDEVTGGEAVEVHAAGEVACFEGDGVEACAYFAVDEAADFLPEQVVDGEPDVGGFGEVEADLGGVAEGVGRALPQGVVLRYFGRGLYVSSELAE